MKYLRILTTPFILQCQHDILLPRSGFGRTLNPLRETSTLLELAVSNPYDSSNTAPRIIIRSQVVRQQRRRNQVIKRKPEHVLKTRFQRTQTKPANSSILRGPWREKEEAEGHAEKTSKRLQHVLSRGAEEDYRQIRERGSTR